MPGVTTAYQNGVHGSRPAASAGCILYACSTHSLIYRSDGTTWTTWMTIGSSTTTVASDAIWDAAGDLAVGSGADTAAKLAIGAAGAALSVINGAVAWDSGTSFPVSKLTGDRYWRTDLRGEYFWDGTRWLSTELYQFTIGMSAGGVGGGIPMTSSGTFHRAPFPRAGQASIWVETLITTFFVSGGTALSGSHKWVGTAGDNVTAGSLGTININSGASNAWRLDSQTVNAVFASTLFEILVGMVKTGTPGDLYVHPSFLYRLIAT